MAINIVLTTEPLNVQSCADWVMTPESGGIDMFIGTVRNATQGKTVLRLEFEAYGRMALSEMNKIATDILNKWPAHRVLIHHRTGVLPVGEIPVIIAISAAHRAAAFEACRYAIDTLKQTVPIWKKEFFEDGEQWVTPTP